MWKQGNNFFFLCVMYKYKEMFWLFQDLIFGLNKKESVF